jgi:twinkle protein
MISAKTIQLVKDRANIYDVLNDYVKVKKEGSDYVALCPFHNEKTPSFKISPSKNIYKCFGCGVSGDAIEFVKEHKKVSFSESVKILASKYNINIQEDMNDSKKKYEKPIPRLEKLSKPIIDRYEKVRCISNNTLLRFNVTQSIEWMPKAQKEITTINYNYYQDGELVNIKFRGANKDFKLAKDAKLIFYNIDSIKDVEEAIIVEGEEECHTFYECGEYAVVSVPNGANVKGNVKLEYLDNCYEYFEDKKRIYIATDGDDAGRRLCEELSRRLGKERCYIVQYSTNEVVPICNKDGEIISYRACKDANEVLVYFGKQAVLDLKNNAKLYPLEGESTIDDIQPLLYDYYNFGYPKGANSGMLDYIGEKDGYLTFIPQQLTVVTGINFSGKDEVVNNICVGLAKSHGWKTAICQFEENTEITASKLLEKYTGKAFDFRKDFSKRMSVNEFQDGLQFIGEYFKLINVDSIDTTIESILDKAKEMIFRYGINVLVISPWNCIEHNVPIGMPETNYVSLVLSKITSFIKKYNIHCFLVAHPTKMAKNQQGKYEVPTLQNISGSVHFANKAHNGLSIYRNFDTGITEVHIQKAKFYWLGQVGLRQFVYDTQTRQYSSIDVSDIPKDEQKEWYSDLKQADIF